MPSGLQPALARIHPITQVALELVFLAFLAAIPRQPLREIALLGAVAFFAVDALQASSGALGIRQVARSRPGQLVAVQAAAVVMASMWGDRLAPGDGVGRIFPFGVAAIMVLATAFLGMLPARVGQAGPPLAAAIGSLAAWALSTQVLGATDLWQPVTAGCALAGAIAIVLSMTGSGGSVGSAIAADEDPPAPLALAITLCAGVAMVLIGRQYGMYGVAVAGIALIPLALSNLRIASLLSAVFSGRAMLQWALMAVPLAPAVGPASAAGASDVAAAAGATGAAVMAGLDITRPYALAALVAGLVLATAPSLISPYLKSQAAQVSTLLALIALPPLAAVIVRADALPALVVGMLAAAVALPPTTHRALPVLLTYSGAISALLAPPLADLTPLPEVWRLVALAVAVGVVTMAVVTAARSGAGSSAPSS